MVIRGDKVPLGCILYTIIKLNNFNYGMDGGGKTYISKCLLEHLDADHFNADAIRTQHNDWDFSEEGRMRQVHRMKDLCRESEKPYAIMDFVCPFTKVDKF